jgi:hypothetical protein
MYSSRFGLVVNMAKTMILSSSPPVPSSFSGSWVNLYTECGTILGVPFSFNQKLLALELSSIIRSSGTDLSNFFELDDPQLLLLAYRSVISQRLSFLCRSLSPFDSYKVFEFYDKELSPNFALALGLDPNFPGNLFDLVFVPISAGGLGIRQPSFYNAVSFISSMLSAIPVFKCFNCLDSQLIWDANAAAVQIFHMNLLELRDFVFKKFEGVQVENLVVHQLFDPGQSRLIDPLLDFSQVDSTSPNLLLSYKGSQRLLSRAYENFAIDRILRSSASNSDVVYRQLRDNWLPHLKERLGSSWKTSLPFGYGRFPPASFRGCVAFQYRCPRFVPSSIDLVQNSMLKCHVCYQSITLNMDAPDVGNNGVCHAVRCKKMGFGPRHGAVGRVLSKFVSDAGIPIVGYETLLPRLVDSHLLSDHLSKKRIDFVINNAGFQHAYDQSIVHCSRMVNSDRVLENKVKLKNDKYSDLLRRRGIDFSPLIISSLGATSKQFDFFVHRVKQLARDNGISLNIRGFYSSLSCVLASFAGSYFARAYYNVRF